MPPVWHDAGELWALRYPATDGLFLLDRPAGAGTGPRRLEQTSTLGMRVRSRELADAPVVVLAASGSPTLRAGARSSPGDLSTCAAR